MIAGIIHKVSDSYEQPLLQSVCSQRKCYIITINILSPLAMDESVIKHTNSVPMDSGNRRER